MGAGSMAETAYTVPVYRGWPEKYYQVLGSLSFPNPNARWDEGIINAAAQEAKKQNGDAIIIRQGAEFGVSKIAGAKNDPLVLSSYQTTALVIRWLSPQEIRERELLLEEFLQRFSANEPWVAANRTVAHLIVTLLLQEGTEMKSPRMFDQFKEVMTKVSARDSDSLAGEWVFKSAHSISSSISGGDERTSLGTATVTVDGENVAVVSNRGTSEFNFTSTLSKNRLAGQVGLGQFSSKSDGAATPDQISLNFQTLTSDGTVRGNVVLQRLTSKSPKRPATAQTL